MHKGRLESLSDNVFAVALTVLVFDIKVPGVDVSANGAKHPLDVITASLPHDLGYVITFLVISIIWLQHHWIFRHIDHVDNVIFFLNIVLLMSVVLFPLPTGMLASYLNASRFQNTAAAIYGASLVFTAAVVSLMWLSVSLRRQRVASQLGHVTAQRLTLRILMAPALYAVGLGISLLNVVVGISCYVAIALLQLVLLRPSVLNQATTEESAENS